jgi:hypothetical protein
MTTVGCLRCGVWYDPARPHVCGVIGDDIARELEARIYAFEQRLRELEVEPRSRFNALERRVEEIEAGLGGATQEMSDVATFPDDSRSVDRQSGRMTPDQPVDENPKPRFDRKANHRRYMREWRARQTALRRQQQGVRP